jgi:hypothetical protein
MRLALSCLKIERSGFSARLTSLDRITGREVAGRDNYFLKSVKGVFGRRGEVAVSIPE